MAIERIVPGTAEWEAYYQNHIARYEFAGNYLKQRDVGSILDAACGAGYGSQYLSKAITGVKVTGIDKSDDALKIANRYFKNDNVQFINDDCHTLKATSNFGFFDSVVSFETLEHLPFPQQFIERCYYNLKKQGILIISTPNQLVSSPDGLEWKYHEKEYKPEEFIKILKEGGFDEIDLYGQRITSSGKFRRQMRGELNRLYSNPFIRFGRWMQKVVRNRRFPAVLPEQKEDIEIIRYNTDELYNEGVNGPFVLIAICTK